MLRDQLNIIRFSKKKKQRYKLTLNDEAESRVSLLASCLLCDSVGYKAGMLLLQ